MKHFISPQVLHARKVRGRDLDFAMDRCRNCLHWLPPVQAEEKWGACGLDQHKCTSEGLCALHVKAASDVET